MVYRIGIDIGGAFTDLIAFDEETGEVIWVKDETTPANPAIGVLNTIKKSDLDLSKAKLLIHGQTLVINTIIERKGAKVGLITTKGFRDVLELQRCNRRDMYNFRYKKPEPFVPRYLRLEVDERVMADGTIIRPLNENDVVNATKKLLNEGVESICISFINSYANPENELKAGMIVKKMANGIPITLGHEITREWREFERTNTAVLNAYVKPKINNYLNTLENEIKKLGYNGTFFAMLSNGGMATFEFAREYPIYTVESGPVAGVIGAVTLGEIIGERNIIALDGGSTTTKASLVENLTPRLHSDYYVGRDKFRSGYPIKVPVIDTVEVGNGGTSIAWIDELGNLRVGPRAMGADPGPACYGKGGNEATVTDAYVVNGLINPRYLLGGEMKIFRDLAVKVIKDKVADYYNISVEEAAEGIIKLANENAAYAIRLISIQRGYDPRDFTLIAFGGSGPMFAPFISEELEIRKIIIPVVPPGVFSAWGMLVTDIKHDLIYTNVIRLDKENAENIINDTFKSLESKLIKIYEDEGLDSSHVIINRYADMRYYGQEHTVKVPIPFGEITESLKEEIIERFHEYHEREYAFRLDSPIEIVNFHVTGILKVKKLTLSIVKAEGGKLDDAIIEDRKVFLNGDDMTLPVYNKVKIRPGVKFSGPAIIEDPTSTILLLSSHVAEVDKYGNIVITRRDEI